MGTSGQCKRCDVLLAAEKRRDPERRAHQAELKRKRYEDPAVRESSLLRQAARRRVKGAPPLGLGAKSKLPRPESENMNPKPILRWLEAWAAANPDDSLAQLCVRAGIDYARTFGAARGNGRPRRRRIPLDFIDRVLVSAGELPDTLHALYPIKRLHDDHTGYFDLPDFNGQPGAVVDLFYPEPANKCPIKSDNRAFRKQAWEPPRLSEQLRRIRDEFRGAEGWDNDMPKRAA